MENIITLKNICKTYGSGDGLVTALKPVSLEIGEGEMVAVMGKFGSDSPQDSPNSQSSDFTSEPLRLHFFWCRVASPPEHKKWDLSSSYGAVWHPLPSHKKWDLSLSCGAVWHPLPSHKKWNMS